MSTTYTEADLGVYNYVSRLIQSVFPELLEADVKVCVMLAHNGDGPAIKVHGCAAAAKIKINSLADRAEGKHDATITLDAEVWDGKSERGREALIWHELNHLVVGRDKDTSAIKRDDLGRPKLRMRPDDYTINGFFECGERYSQDSPEAASLMGVVDHWRQRGLFDGWDSPARARSQSRRTAAASH